jgi:hypothetical protein
MLIPFALCQTILGNDPAGVTATTDPIRVGTNNRLTVITTVHSIFPGGIAHLNWQAHVSNDGQNWLAQGPVSGDITATGVSTQGPAAVSCVWLRLQYVFIVTTPGALGAVTFDAVAKLEEA